jgi:hypothetical protein
MGSQVGPAGSSAADALPPELPPLRFGLRQMFGIVAGICVLMAAMVSSSSTTSLVLLLAVVIVTAHVTGTAIGSRLRAHADHRRAWEASHAPTSATRPICPMPATTTSEPPLYSRRASWHRLPLLVAGGALVGLLAGAVLLAETIGHRTSAAGIAVGAVSLGIVGGWCALLGGCFWSILRQGWREAVAQQKLDESRRLTAR